MKHFFAKTLQSRFILVLPAILTMLLSIKALDNGPYLDDHVLKSLLTGKAEPFGMKRSVHNLYIHYEPSINEGLI